GPGGGPGRAVANGLLSGRSRGGWRRHGRMSRQKPTRVEWTRATSDPTIATVAARSSHGTQTQGCGMEEAVARRVLPREGDGITMREVVWRKPFVGVVLAVAVIAVALALGPVERAGAQGPKTLVIAIGADQTGLDPQTVENNESGFIMATIYDSIVNYK